MSQSQPTSTAALRFSEFGDVESVALTKIQKLTANYLARNWAQIPHVTHNDDADVTELEAERTALAQRYSDRRITSLSFHIKAVVAALRAFPKFNASLDDNGDTLIYKKYFNIGVAVDTPKGLLVPVIRNADTKTLPDIALEIETLSNKARTRGISMMEMSGGCFSISSLGRNGGTSFTPIINAPEVAILGVSGLRERPIREADALVWRKMLPLSLSYDHRVINGAEAAAFVAFLVKLLAKPAVDWAF